MLPLLSKVILQLCLYLCVPLLHSVVLPFISAEQPKSAQYASGNWILLRGGAMLLAIGLHLHFLKKERALLLTRRKVTILRNNLLDLKRPMSCAVRAHGWATPAGH